MNTQVHQATNDLPYCLVFAQHPRSNLTLLSELVERMGINDEEDIPDNVYVENGDDNENGEFDNIVEDNSVQSTGETTPLPSTSIQNNEIQTPQITENEPGYYSSEDDIDLIEKYETGYFIQDCMMYKPFSIFPPRQYRATYVFRLDTWLRYTLQSTFTEADRTFVLRCLDDLRKWNDNESEDRVIEDDGTSEIFETWPERIRQYDERQIRKYQFIVNYC